MSEADDIARRVAAKTAPSKRRRVPHGQWKEPGRAVFRLWKENWPISDAVREVMRECGFEDVPGAFNGIRASFYGYRLYGDRTGNKRGRKPRPKDEVPKARAEEIDPMEGL